MQYRSSYTTHNPSSPKPQRASKNKPSYSPGNWKNYLASDLHRPQESRASYDSSGIQPRLMSPINLQSNVSYYQNVQTNTIRDERERKKEEMLKRVRQIQEKVMPLIQNNSSHTIEQDIGWKSRMEQKIAKLQTCVDAMEKNLEIRIEKQVVEFERRMMQKYLELEDKIMKGTAHKQRDMN